MPHTVFVWGIVGAGCHLIFHLAKLRQPASPPTRPTSRTFACQICHDSVCPARNPAVASTRRASHPIHTIPLQLECWIPGSVSRWLATKLHSSHADIPVVLLPELVGC